MEANQHEIKPSEDYIKGFNHGYYLRKHRPELVVSIAESFKDNTQSDYVRVI